MDGWTILGYPTAFAKKKKLTIWLAGALRVFDNGLFKKKIFNITVMENINSCHKNQFIFSFLIKCF